MEKSIIRRKPVTGRDGKPVRAKRTSADKSFGEKRTYTRKRTSDSDEGEAPKKRTYTRKSYGEGKPYGEKKSYGEKRTYTRRKPAASEEGEAPKKRTYTRKSYGEGKPYGEKKAFGEKKQYGERKSYGEKRTYGDKPYAEKRSYGEKKTYGDKPYGEKKYAKKGYATESKYVKKEYKSTLKKDKPAVERPETQEYVRLNKFIANSGICSRREADEFIQTGLVTVNGEHVTELGRKVRYDDDVRFNGERVKGEQKVYLVMNKPKDYVTTLSDPHAEKTVMDLISAEQCPQRIYPVGRLDKATTGVLMFTNDGELTEKLTHPAYGARKIYHVFLDKNLKKSDFDAILEGIELEDGAIHADSLSYVDGEMSQVGVEIHSGRNRIVRRIFEHFGYNVKKLDRVYFAGLTKKALKRGEWRFLTEAEVNKLKMGSFE